MSMYVEACCECGKPVDDRRETVWVGVKGFEKKRDQGGTNHIALREPTAIVMCNACMILRQRGLSGGQLGFA